MRTRFVRVATGLLLLSIGLPLLLAGVGLWQAGRHRDDGGSFAATLERIDTTGRALVVPDLDALLRREAPFARSGHTRLRITGQTTDGPAFLGLAPAVDVARYLEPAPHALIERVRITRGPLPSQVRQVAAGAPAAGAGAIVPGPDALPGPGRVARPGDQFFWTGHGIGVLDLAVDDLGDGPVSLVVMRPDGGARLGVDLRAELRAGWLDPAVVAVVAAGAVLVILGMAGLAWPVRPREVVFVVEPNQVPVLAGKLGVAALDDLGYGGTPGVRRTGRWRVRRRAAGAAAGAVGAVGRSRPGNRRSGRPVERAKVLAAARSATTARPDTLDDVRRAAGRAGGVPPVTLELDHPGRGAGRESAVAPRARPGGSPVPPVPAALPVSPGSFGGRVEAARVFPPLPSLRPAVPASPRPGDD
nr:hypothetical protein [Micromonospora sp. DSM 115978]